MFLCTSFTPFTQRLKTDIDILSTSTIDFYECEKKKEKGAVSFMSLAQHNFGSYDIHVCSCSYCLLN